MDRTLQPAWHPWLTQSVATSIQGFFQCKPNVLGSGYGIVAGKKVPRAMLRLTPYRAKWGSAESWHPMQRGRFDDQDYWLLELPYADPRELVMNLLRHVHDMKAVRPEGLRTLVREKLLEAVKRLAL